jgi:hypothetical protein
MEDWVRPIIIANYHSAEAVGHRKAAAARIATRVAVGYHTNTRRTLPQLGPDQGNQETS